MCGRFAQNFQAADLAAFFDALGVPDAWESHFNLAPTQTVAIVRARESADRAGSAPTAATTPTTQRTTGEKRAAGMTGAQVASGVSGASGPTSAPLETSTPVETGAPAQTGAPGAPGETAGLLRELAFVHWGLIPGWAPDRSIASKLFNARSETAALKPSFRDAFARRRCIVPANCFYEWRRHGREKQPLLICRRDRQPLALAGLWERWQSPEGAAVETCSILTTAANRYIRPIHDRMPVILEGPDFTRWIDPRTPQDAIQALCAPCADSRLTAFPVAMRVNSVRNDDAGLVEPIGDEASWQVVDSVDGKPSGATSATGVAGTTGAAGATGTTGTTGTTGATDANRVEGQTGSPRQGRRRHGRRNESDQGRLF